MTNTSLVLFFALASSAMAGSENTFDNTPMACRQASQICDTARGTDLARQPLMVPKGTSRNDLFKGYKQVNEKIRKISAKKYPNQMSAENRQALTILSVRIGIGLVALGLHSTNVRVEVQPNDPNAIRNALTSAGELARWSAEAEKMTNQAKPFRELHESAKKLSAKLEQATPGYSAKPFPTYASR